MDTVQINLLKSLYRGYCEVLFAEPLCAYELGHVPSFTRVFHPAAHQDQSNHLPKDDKDFYEQIRRISPSYAFAGISWKTVLAYMQNQPHKTSLQRQIQTQIKLVLLSLQ